MNELIKTKQSLLKLIKEAEEQFSSTGKALLDIEDYVAEYLTAKGVIVPPCYIGQDIWHITKHYDGRIEIRKGKVSMLQQKADKSWKIRITVNSSVWDFTQNEIGKRYFFSKEETEQVLKGGE